MHDLRKIPQHNVPAVNIDLQCLKCGSVFRSSSLNMALALIDCEEEKRNREDVLVESIPMMVSPESEKYATPSAGH